jgi:S-adenosylmethionine hydrolase
MWPAFPAFPREQPALPGQIEGKIVASTESGNLVSDIANDRLRDVPHSMATIKCDEHETVGIFAANHPEQPFTLMAVLGSSGCLELTIVGESAKAMLGVRVGEKIVVRW